MCAGAVELRNTLVSQFGVELPATATFDYPTVAALAAFIASQGAAPAAAQQITEIDDGLVAGDADSGASAPAAAEIDGIRYPLRAGCYKGQGTARCCSLNFSSRIA